MSHLPFDGRGSGGIERVDGKPNSAGVGRNLNIAISRILGEVTPHWRCSLSAMAKMRPFAAMAVQCRRHGGVVSP